MFSTCVMRYALLPLALGIAAPVTAKSAQGPAAAYVKPAPPGELVDIGGRRLPGMGSPVGRPGCAEDIGDLE